MNLINELNVFIVYYITFADTYLCSMLQNTIFHIYIKRTLILDWKCVGDALASSAEECQNLRQDTKFS